MDRVDQVGEELDHGFEEPFVVFCLDVAGHDFLLLEELLHDSIEEDVGEHFELCGIAGALVLVEEAADSLSDVYRVCLLDFHGALWLLELH